MLTSREPDGRQPSGTLTIAFATAEVTLIGTRLGRIADHLRDGNLPAVRVVPDRYADLIRFRPYVSRIAVTRVAKQ